MLRKGKNEVKNATETHKKNQLFFVKIGREKKVNFLYILNKNERRNMRKLALNDEILLKNREAGPLYRERSELGDER